MSRDTRVLTPIQLSSACVFYYQFLFLFHSLCSDVKEIYQFGTSIHLFSKSVDTNNYNQVRLPEADLAVSDTINKEKKQIIIRRMRYTYISCWHEKNIL